MWIKRVMDLVVAVMALLLTSPVWLLAALLTKIASPGPVFYRQRRIGIHGMEYMMMKFRSIHVGVDSTSLTSKNDRRVTTPGKWLRATSFDEIPQLINVIRGEMSIVGPRPALPEMVPYYTEEERRRLDAKPGLTGWAQVNGRNTIPYHERLRLDQWYVEHWSIRLDLFVLLKTIPALFSRRGLSQDDPRPWEQRPISGQE